MRVFHRQLPAFAVLAAFPCAALAQTPGPPRIFPNGVVNAASFLAPPGPGSGLARGSVFSIFGENLGPAEGVAADSFPVPEELAGVSVEITLADGRVFRAPALYVSERQINAILPSGVPAGFHFFTVIRDGVRGSARPAKVVRSSVGLFTAPFLGHRLIAGLEPGGELRPGDVVTLWATGLGPISSSDSALPPVGEIATPLQVFVGSRTAEILYQGRSGCCAGVDQINIRIPDEAPAGCFTPVWVEVRGTVVSNMATLAVSDGGWPCRTADSPRISQSFQAPAGRVVLTRTEASGGASATVEAVFRAPSSDPRFAPFGRDDPVSLPPRGTCIAYSPWPMGGEFAALDAGAALALSGPAGNAKIPRVAGGDYRLAPAEMGSLLGEGEYRVEGRGGTGFPPFSATLRVAPAAGWVGRDALPALFRSSGLNIAWDRGTRSAGDVVFAGWSGAAGREPSDQAFLCRAAVGDGLLRVPPAALAHLPAEELRLRFADVSTAEFEFSTDGLESGLLVYRAVSEASARVGPVRLPSTPLRLPNGVEIQVELAATGAEQARGLMFRPELPRAEGMLFLYDTLGLRRFWMLNTLIPLDIIWLDADRRIIFISADTPPCPPELGFNCPSFGPAARSQFVLEIGGGEAARQALAPGDRMEW